MPDPEVRSAVTAQDSPAGGPLTDVAQGKGEIRDEEDLGQGGSPEVQANP